ncbi:FtsX-like permease family protein [Streptoalloteichus hindustanus]|uniref:FtsX-like permease family protein n=1 Tax=Streptoalloteichus hindustanus TaxID=2017 RepID=A0A1M4U2D6_STRHI|nr:FtsX-like permease family protein [Streptoalloteichus hindustanus]SHE50754.1 FtsX-like permease family protein [Streptoalloteichus hindustanus]
MANRVGRWWADVLLGVRLTVGGGRGSWGRALLMAVGVGAATAVLLLAASVGPARQAQHEREDARAPVDLTHPGQGAETVRLWARALNSTWRGHLVSGVELAAAGPGAPVPPGIPRLPGPGEVYLSPALAELAGQDELIRQRFPERVIGLVGEEALSKPHELWFYAGVGPDRANRDSGLSPVTRFGGVPGAADPDEVARLLVTAAVAVVMTPIAIFVVAATRIGAAGRDRRLAAIRLVGAGPAQIRRIAAGEAVFGALLGSFLGAGLFLAGRPFARVVEVAGTGFFPADLAPRWPWAVAIILLVPVVALGSALAALRRGGEVALASVRRGAPLRRRLWWRLALAALGAVALLGVARRWHLFVRSFTWVENMLAIAVVLVLVGCAALAPWLVDLLARRWRPGALPVLLAVRRLRHDTTSPRILAGLVVVIASGLTLQVMLETGERADTSFTTRHADAGVAVSVPTDLRSGGVVDQVRRDVLQIPGVRSVTGVRVLVPVARDAAEARWLPQVIVLECDALAGMGVRDCRAGKAWHQGEMPLVGESVVLRDQTGARVPWSVPPTELLPDRDAARRTLPMFLSEDAVVVAAGANPALERGPVHILHVEGEAGNLAERVAAVAQRVDRMMHVHTGWTPRERRLTSVRDVALPGLGVVLLLAALSLVVAALDQVGERRRSLAVLTAVGVPRRAQAWAVLWQNAVLAAVAFVVAVPAGVVTGGLVLLASGGLAWKELGEITVSWASLGAAAVVVTALMLLVTALTLPAVRAAVHPTALRHE